MAQCVKAVYMFGIGKTCYEEEHLLSEYVFFKKQTGGGGQYLYWLHWFPFVIYKMTLPSYIEEMLLVPEL